MNSVCVMEEGKHPIINYMTLLQQPAKIRPDHVEIEIPE